MQEDNNVFETSIDSGISVDIASPSADEKPENKMKTFQEILFFLERDRLLRAEQRKRLSQLSERRQRKRRTEEPCNVCCSSLDIDNIKSSAKCITCQKCVCRGRECSVWIPSRGGWECQLCNQSQESIAKSSEWLHQQITGKYLSPLSARSEPALARGGLSPAPELDRRSSVASSLYGDQKEKVREIIEETLADMLGGQLDNVSVNQLSKNRAYLPTWENGEEPGISQFKLKRFIEKIINDSLRLPNFTNEPLTPDPKYDQSLPFFDPKKYQELLATAVLNKIVDSYNYEQKFDKNKDAATDCSDLDRNHNALIGRKVQSGSISSSSIEPESDSSITDPPRSISQCRDFSRSDSDSNLFHGLMNSDNRNDSSMLTKYLAKHNVPLPDFSIESDSSNEDNNLSDSRTFENTWEENWLFKKKRSSQESMGSVGMLVPCPKVDVKTQIGDRTADELSDLSEAGSDCENNNVDEMEDPPQNALIQNRNIIGGKSPVGIFDELLEQTSMISNSSIPDGYSPYTETKNDFVLGDDLNHDLGKSNGHYVAGEAVNSFVDTQTLQNNFASKSKEKRTSNKTIETSQLKKSTLQRRAIYVSTKDIPESELTSSSTASSADNAPRKTLTHTKPRRKSTTTNPTNILTTEEPPSPPTLSEKILKKIQCTKASAIQFLVVVSMAPSLASSPTVDSETFNRIVQVANTAGPSQGSSPTEESSAGAEETASTKAKDSDQNSSAVETPNIEAIPLPEEECPKDIGLDVFIPPPMEFGCKSIVSGTNEGTLEPQAIHIEQPSAINEKLDAAPNIETVAQPTVQDEPKISDPKPEPSEEKGEVPSLSEYIPGESTESIKDLTTSAESKGGNTENANNESDIPDTLQTVISAKIISTNPVDVTGAKMTLSETNGDEDQLALPNNTVVSISEPTINAESVTSEVELVETSEAITKDPEGGKVESKTSELAVENHTENISKQPLTSRIENIIGNCATVRTEKEDINSPKATRDKFSIAETISETSGPVITSEPAVTEAVSDNSDEVTISEPLVTTIDIKGPVEVLSEELVLAEIIPVSPEPDVSSLVETILEEAVITKVEIPNTQPEGEEPTKTDDGSQSVSNRTEISSGFKPDNPESKLVEASNTKKSKISKPETESATVGTEVTESIGSEAQSAINTEPVPSSESKVVEAGDSFLKEPTVYAAEAVTIGTKVATIRASISLEPGFATVLTASNQERASESKNVCKDPMESDETPGAVAEVINNPPCDTSEIISIETLSDENTDIIALQAAEASMEPEPKIESPVEVGIVSKSANILKVPASSENVLISPELEEVRKTEIYQEEPAVGRIKKDSSETEVVRAIESISNQPVTAEVEPATSEPEAKPESESGKVSDEAKSIVVASEKSEPIIENSKTEPTLGDTQPAEATNVPEIISGRTDNSETEQIIIDTAKNTSESSSEDTRNQRETEPKSNPEEPAVTQATSSETEPTNSPPTKVKIEPAEGTEGLSEIQEKTVDCLKMEEPVTKTEAASSIEEPAPEQATSMEEGAANSPLNVSVADGTKRLSETQEEPVDCPKIEEHVIETEPAGSIEEQALGQATSIEEEEANPPQSVSDQIWKNEIDPVDGTESYLEVLENSNSRSKIEKPSEENEPTILSEELAVAQPTGCEIQSPNSAPPKIKTEPGDASERIANPENPIDSSKMKEPAVGIKLASCAGELALKPTTNTEDDETSIPESVSANPTKDKIRLADSKFESATEVTNESAISEDKANNRYSVVASLLDSSSQEAAPSAGDVTAIGTPGEGGNTVVESSLLQLVMENVQSIAPEFYEAEYSSDSLGYDSAQSEVDPEDINAISVMAVAEIKQDAVSLLDNNSNFTVSAKTSPTIPPTEHTEFIETASVKPLEGKEPQKTTEVVPHKPPSTETQVEEPPNNTEDDKLEATPDVKTPSAEPAEVKSETENSTNTEIQAITKSEEGIASQILPDEPVNEKAKTEDINAPAVSLEVSKQDEVSSAVDSIIEQSTFSESSLSVSTFGQIESANQDLKVLSEPENIAGEPTGKVPASSQPELVTTYQILPEAMKIEEVDIVEPLNVKVDPTTTTAEVSSPKISNVIIDPENSTEAVSETIPPSSEIPASNSEPTSISPNKPSEVNDISVEDTQETKDPTVNNLGPVEVAEMLPAGVGAIQSTEPEEPKLILETMKDPASTDEKQPSKELHSVNPTQPKTPDGKVEPITTKAEVPTAPEVSDNQPEVVSTISSNLDSTAQLSGAEEKLVTDMEPKDISVQPICGEPESPITSVSESVDYQVEQIVTDIGVPRTGSPVPAIVIQKASIEEAPADEPAVSSVDTSAAHNDESIDMQHNAPATMFEVEDSKVIPDCDQSSTGASKSSPGKEETEQTKDVISADSSQAENSTEKASEELQDLPETDNNKSEKPNPSPNEVTKESAETQGNAEEEAKSNLGTTENLASTDETGLKTPDLKIDPKNNTEAWDGAISTRNVCCESSDEIPGSNSESPNEPSEVKQIPGEGSQKTECPTVNKLGPVEITEIPPQVADAIQSIELEEPKPNLETPKVSATTGGNESSDDLHSVHFAETKTTDAQVVPQNSAEEAISEAIHTTETPNLTGTSDESAAPNTETVNETSSELFVEKLIPIKMTIVETSAVPVETSENPVKFEEPIQGINKIYDNSVLAEAEPTELSSIDRAGNILSASPLPPPPDFQCEDTPPSSTKDLPDIALEHKGSNEMNNVRNALDASPQPTTEATESSLDLSSTNDSTCTEKQTSLNHLTSEDQIRHADESEYEKPKSTKYEEVTSATDFRPEISSAIDNASSEVEPHVNDPNPEGHTDDQVEPDQAITETDFTTKTEDTASATELVSPKGAEKLYPVDASAQCQIAVEQEVSRVESMTKPEDAKSVKQSTEATLERDESLNSERMPQPQRTSVSGCTIALIGSTGDNLVESSILRVVAEAQPISAEVLADATTSFSEAMKNQSSTDPGSSILSAPSHPKSDVIPESQTSQPESPHELTEPSKLDTEDSKPQLPAKSAEVTIEEPQPAKKLLQSPDCNSDQAPPSTFVEDAANPASENDSGCIGPEATATGSSLRSALLQKETSPEHYYYYYYYVQNPTSKESITENADTTDAHHPNCTQEKIVPPGVIQPIAWAETLPCASDSCITNSEVDEQAAHELNSLENCISSPQSPEPITPAPQLPEAVANEQVTSVLRITEPIPAGQASTQPQLPEKNQSELSEHKQPFGEPVEDSKVPEQIVTETVAGSLNLQESTVSIGSKPSNQKAQSTQSKLLFSEAPESVTLERSVSESPLPEASSEVSPENTVLVSELPEPVAIEPGVSKSPLPEAFDASDSTVSKSSVSEPSPEPVRSESSLPVQITSELTGGTSVAEVESTVLMVQKHALTEEPGRNLGEGTVPTIASRADSEPSGPQSCTTESAEKSTPKGVQTSVLNKAAPKVSDSTFAEASSLNHVEVDAEKETLVVPYLEPTTSETIDTKSIQQTNVSTVPEFVTAETIVSDASVTVVTVTKPEATALPMSVATESTSVKSVISEPTDATPAATEPTNTESLLSEPSITTSIHPETGVSKTAAPEQLEEDSSVTKSTISDLTEGEGLVPDSTIPETHSTTNELVSNVELSSVDQTTTESIYLDPRDEKLTELQAPTAGDFNISGSQVSETVTPQQDDAEQFTPEPTMGDPSHDEPIVLTASNNQELTSANSADLEATTSCLTTPIAADSDQTVLEPSNLTVAEQSVEYKTTTESIEKTPSVPEAPIPEPTNAQEIFKDSSVSERLSEPMQSDPTISSKETIVEPDQELNAVMDETISEPEHTGTTVAGNLNSEPNLAESTSSEPQTESEGNRDTKIQSNAESVAGQVVPEPPEPSIAELSRLDGIEPEPTVAKTSIAEPSGETSGPSADSEIASLPSVTLAAEIQSNTESVADQVVPEPAPVQPSIPQLNGMDESELKSTVAETSISEPSGESPGPFSESIDGNDVFDQTVPAATTSKPSVPESQGIQSTDLKAETEGTPEQVAIDTITKVETTVDETQTSIEIASEQAVPELTTSEITSTEPSISTCIVSEPILQEQAVPEAVTYTLEIEDIETPMPNVECPGVCRDPDSSFVIYQTLDVPEVEPLEPIVFESVDEPFRLVSTDAVKEILEASSKATTKCSDTLDQIVPGATSSLPNYRQANALAVSPRVQTIPQISSEATLTQTTASDIVQERNDSTSVILWEQSLVDSTPIVADSSSKEPDVHAEILPGASGPRTTEYSVQNPADSVVPDPRMQDLISPSGINALGPQTNIDEPVALNATDSVVTEPIALDPIVPEPNTEVVDVKDQNVQEPTIVSKSPTSVTTDAVQEANSAAIPVPINSEPETKEPIVSEPSPDEQCDAGLILEIQPAPTSARQFPAEDVSLQLSDLSVPPFTQPIDRLESLEGNFEGIVAPPSEFEDFDPESSTTDAVVPAIVTGSSSEDSNDRQQPDACVLEKPATKEMQFLQPESGYVTDETIMKTESAEAVITKPAILDDISRNGSTSDELERNTTKQTDDSTSSSEASILQSEAIKEVELQTTITNLPKLSSSKNPTSGTNISVESTDQQSSQLTASPEMDATELTTLEPALEPAGQNSSTVCPQPAPEESVQTVSVELNLPVEPRGPSITGSSTVEQTAEVIVSSTISAETTTSISSEEDTATMATTIELSAIIEEPLSESAAPTPSTNKLDASKVASKKIVLQKTSTENHPSKVLKGSTTQKTTEEANAIPKSAEAHAPELPPTVESLTKEAAEAITSEPLTVKDGPPKVTSETTTLEKNSTKSHPPVPTLSDESPSQQTTEEVNTMPESSEPEAAKLPAEQRVTTDSLTGQTCEAIPSKSVAEKDDPIVDRFDSLPAETDPRPTVGTTAEPNFLEAVPLKSENTEFTKTKSTDTFVVEDAVSEPFLEAIASISNEQPDLGAIVEGTASEMPEFSENTSPGPPNCTSENVGITEERPGTKKVIGSTLETVTSITNKQPKLEEATHDRISESLKSESAIEEPIETAVQEPVARTSESSENSSDDTPKCITETAVSREDSEDTTSPSADPNIDTAHQISPPRQPVNMEPRNSSKTANSAEVQEATETANEQPSIEAVTLTTEAPVIEEPIAQSSDSSEISSSELTKCTSKTADCAENSKHVTLLSDANINTISKVSKDTPVEENIKLPDCTVIVLQETEGNSSLGVADPTTQAIEETIEPSQNIKDETAEVVQKSANTEISLTAEVQTNPLNQNSSKGQLALEISETTTKPETESLIDQGEQEEQKIEVVITADKSSEQRTKDVEAILSDPDIISESVAAKSEENSSFITDLVCQAVPSQQTKLPGSIPILEVEKVTPSNEVIDSELPDYDKLSTEPTQTPVRRQSIAVASRASSPITESLLLTTNLLLLPALSIFSGELIPEVADNSNVRDTQKDKSSDQQVAVNSGSKDTRNTVTRGTSPIRDVFLMPVLDGAKVELDTNSALEMGTCDCGTEGLNTDVETLAQVSDSIAQESDEKANNCFYTETTVDETSPKQKVETAGIVSGNPREVDFPLTELKNLQHCIEQLIETISEEPSQNEPIKPSPAVPRTEQGMDSVACGAHIPSVVVETSVKALSTKSQSQAEAVQVSIEKHSSKNDVNSSVYPNILSKEMTTQSELVKSTAGSNHAIEIAIDSAPEEYLEEIKSAKVRKDYSLTESNETTVDKSASIGYSLNVAEEATANDCKLETKSKEETLPESCELQVEFFADPTNHKTEAESTGANDLFVEPKEKTVDVTAPAEPSPSVVEEMTSEPSAAVESDSSEKIFPLVESTANPTLHLKLDEVLLETSTVSTDLTYKNDKSCSAISPEPTLPVSVEYSENTNYQNYQPSLGETEVIDAENVASATDEPTESMLRIMVTLLSSESADIPEPEPADLDTVNEFILESAEDNTTMITVQELEPSDNSSDELQTQPPVEHSRDPSIERSTNRTYVSSSEDISSYETAPSSLSNILVETPPLSLTDQDSIPADLPNIAPPTVFGDNNGETQSDSDPCHQPGDEIKIFTIDSMETLKVRTTDSTPSTPGSRFELGEEAFAALHIPTPEKSSIASSNEDTKDKDIADDETLEITEMEGQIYISSEGTSLADQELWHVQRGESEDSYLTANSSEYEPEQEPELSITPPEISLCYMTSTVLESIPEDLEISESFPEAQNAPKNSLNSNVAESIDGDSLDSMDTMVGDSIADIDDFDSGSEDPLVDDEIAGISDSENGTNTTQQEVIPHSYDSDSIDPTSGCTNICTDSQSSTVEFSTLPTDKQTSTESSSTTTTTTTDDTVRTAIESPSRRIQTEQSAVAIAVESHKDSTPPPPPTTSPVKKAYSVSVSIELTNEPTNTTSDVQPAQDLSSTGTATSEVTTTAQPAPTLTTSTSIDKKDPKYTKLETLKYTAFSQPLSDDDDTVQVGHLSNLLPGSIAEREHKKWYHAVDMPNNPYSKEALSRRLSNNSDRPLDIPNINSPLEKAKSEDRLSGGEDADGVITEPVKVDYRRYGRDYYINDTNGTSEPTNKKLTASLSLYGLSTNTRDENASDKELTSPPRLHQTLSSSLSSLQRSNSWGDKRSTYTGGGGSSCDIFTARPVRVEESDPILSKATKLEYLSTPDRDFYLLPTEEISSLRSISASEHSLSQAGDSLTPSEDSDTIRVYDLKTQQTRLIRDDESIGAGTAVKELNNTNTLKLPHHHHPAGVGSTTVHQENSSPHVVVTTQQQRSFRTSISNRGSTPSAFRFLQPKRKLYDTRRVMSEDTLSVAYDRDQISRSNGSVEKSVIEEDVIPALPSVKALAKAFQGTSQDSSVQVNKPKIRYRLSFSWKSVDVKTQEESKETVLQEVPKTNEDSKTCPGPSNDSYSPSYEQKYIPVEAPPQSTVVSVSQSTLEEKEITPQVETAEKVTEQIAEPTPSVPEPQPTPQQPEESIQQVQVPSEPEKTAEPIVMSQQISEPPKEVVGELTTPQEPCKDSYSPPYDQKYFPAEALQPEASATETAEKSSKANVENTLEWKEDNIEIVSTPKDEQQATPPNTPSEAVQADETKPLIEPTSLLIETKEESSVESEQTTVSAAEPVREPSDVEKFIESERNASIVQAGPKPVAEPQQSEVTHNSEAKAAVEPMVAPEVTSATIPAAEPTPAPEPIPVVEPTPAEEPTPAAEPSPVADSSLAPAEAPTSTPVPVEHTPTPAPEATLTEEKTPNLNGQEPVEAAAITSNSSDETKPAENGYHEQRPGSPVREDAQSELPGPNTVEQKRAEIKFTQEMPARDRPISPVLVPGELKSTLAFFENLNKKS